MTQPDPGRIMQIGTGFWASKVLLSAVELGLFTALAREPMTGDRIVESLGLHRRAVPDFTDALVALGLLERDGDGPDAVYRNTSETALYLDRERPEYVGGILEMFNDRLYRFWGGLTEGLRTGKPQNEIKDSEASMFARLYEDPARLEQFMSAMSGASRLNFTLFAERFDFSGHTTLTDVGGATGQLSLLVAERHRHMRCTSVDLPKVTEIAGRNIAAQGHADRVTAVAADFFADPIPPADVVTMGMILHDWNLEKKRLLIAKAYDALPAGGALVVIEALIDDERRENVFGLLMSLNMLIEFGEAFDYTGADFFGWCREAGFREFETIPLAGPGSAAVAYK